MGKRQLIRRLIIQVYKSRVQIKHGEDTFLLTLKKNSIVPID